MLIAFCGIDGSGKSSHAKEVSKWLRSMEKKAQTLSPIKYRNSFFDDFIEAKTIYEKNLNKKVSDEIEGILLAFEFSRQCKKIKELVKEGEIIIADRWTYSHYAYTYARNVENDFIISLLENCLTPDLVFLLDIPVHVALKRIDNRGERGYNENYKILSRAREKYLEIAKKQNFIILDSTNTFDSNQEIIRNTIKKIVV